MNLVGNTTYENLSFNRLTNLVQGLKTYQLYKNYNGLLNGTSSASVRDQVASWNNVSTGAAYDFPDVASSLQELNDITKCESRVLRSDDISMLPQQAMCKHRRLKFLLAAKLRYKS